MAAGVTTKLWTLTDLVRVAVPGDAEGPILMANTFKPGDVVQLKSGGPKMTVVEAHKNLVGTPVVVVHWYDAEGETKQEILPETAVEAG